VSEWMKEVNEILRPHRFRQEDTFVRFQATKYPKPTVAIVVYSKGEKIFERPIRRLEEFIEDLSDVIDILKEARREEARNRAKNKNAQKGKSSRRRRRRNEDDEEEAEADEETEDEEDEEEDEEEEERRSKRRSSRRRRPKRD